MVPEFSQEDGETTSKPKINKTPRASVGQQEGKPPIPRRVRRSLPSNAAKVLLMEVEHRRSVADEQKEQAEYELKAK